MPDAVDLLMPKLGLTMTEGRIARWALDSGTRFARGQVVVEIETDKIVNEIEAPADGLFLEQIAPEGETMPVGAPIARWRLDEGATVAGQATPAEAAVSTGSAPATGGAIKPERSAKRIMSTPYARRLAAEAGLDISVIAGTGRGGCIKAADVERAIGGAEATRLPMRANKTQALEAPLSRGGAPSSSARGLSFVTSDVNTARLDELEARISMADLPVPPDRRHYVALGCLRAFTRQGEAEPLVVGFQAETDGEICQVWIGRRDLSLTALTLAHAESLAGRAFRSSDRAHDHAAGILVLAGSATTHAFVPSVPRGWMMAVGIGGAREVFRADPAGAPRLGRELTLALSYDVGVLTHGSALELIGTIKALLEEPLGMLVP